MAAMEIMNFFPLVLQVRTTNQLVSNFFDSGRQVAWTCIVYASEHIKSLLNVIKFTVATELDVS